MATKRKIREKQIEEETAKKRARMEDSTRLGNLPQDLQVRILSFLDTKQAVRTSLLSKTWASLWTLNPVLEFYDSAFHNLYAFDKFVNRVLCLRDRSVKLDRLIFTRRGISSAKILKNVFNYAFSHGVKQLEANIGTSRNNTWPWPACLNTSLHSLTSLKLQSDITIDCPFLGPRFKNLNVLFLKGALVTDQEPFSGFPSLEKLTLLNCDFIIEGKTLSIHARNLSDLTISGYESLNRIELTTPRLRFFGYRGFNFPPLIRTHEGLPLLDTIAIDFNGAHNHLHEKKTFDDLLSFFCALPNATSLTLFWSTVEILSFFKDELVKQMSPFRNLKCLKLDYRNFRYQNRHRLPCKESFYKIPSDVKAYLFLNSPNAEVTTLYPHRWKEWLYKGISSDDYWKAKDSLVSSDIF